MLSVRDDARADLLERAIEAAGRSVRRDDGSEDHNGLTFLQCYYRHIPVEDLADRDPVDVYGAALSHRALAARRPQGTAAVRVHTPTIEANGWASGHTVVEVVTDDMPFLVDSVTSALAQAGQAIHLVIHPQVVVRRSITGELLDVVDVPAGQGGPDTALESWIHVEIGRVTDVEVTTGLERTLLSVLRDVRESVEDWPKMRDTALRVADELSIRPPVGIDDAEVSEAWELLRWLADDHFTFLGVREYELVSEDGEDALRAIPGTGLGILRSDQLVSASFGKLPPEARARAREPRLLILTKANSRSTVHRAAYLDYVGVKTFDDDGRVVGERRFLGLFASSVYTESVLRIPVLRRRTREVLEASGFSMMSHNGKELLQIIETYPRDELFQVPVKELLPVAVAVQHLQERRQLRLFVRPDAYGRFMSCLVYLPRDRYTTDVRLELERILRDAVGGVASDYTARVSESVLARLHFVVRVAPGATLPAIDVAAIEERLAEATRTWADDFADALVDQCGEEAAGTLGRRYGEAFPEAFKEDFSARMAVADVRALESLDSDGDMVLNYYEPFGALPGERRFKIYRSGQPVSLTDVLPVLQQLGVEVIDERPYEVDRRGAGNAWIYDFGLKTDARAVGEGLKERFQDAFSAVWEGRAESDRFNSLVLVAGLTWRQASLLRAYARYLRQAGSTFSQAYVEQCLVANLQLARLLVRLFERRCDPALEGDRAAACADVEQAIEQELDQVASLDEDRILRSLVGLVKATLRTNFFQPAADGSVKPYLSFKFDPSAIHDLPLPRPRFEIWVYSPRVEGVHLRFGLVARGGLRWSDRREDFRTEVLGLVKAQAVKNAVIVPVGAKGGFLPKQLPDPAVDRDAWLAEGVASYTTFISALLDITDNLVDGAVVPPRRVVRHDGDDPYLVVAADKGTATFSDIANGIAQSYGFWLGDAFASGGSVGYDHKAMGITARGAWESVKRHFRELGLDTQTEDFTVAGVGDMSGDVFGNGMLLSEHIRLVAAFDHRHIFLDPSPDPAGSLAERARLFALPRSSWDDYDRALISEGGGVHPRSAKSIPLTPQVRSSLGIGDDVDSMTPADLMKAILQAPLDLLWNGGIGTYVKAAAETHAEVGDKANDSIRVNGDMLRCRVVGEGGNLGCTQRGRIEAAQNGVRLNTDAIDNSAGVDTSDHEVNIKILLDRVVRSGDLTEKQRNELLAVMTDDVAHLVLRDNYEQNVLLGNARYQAALLLPVHRRFIHQLETRGDLDRALEFLPPDGEIDARHGLGLGLTSPELSVLVAYSKMTLAEDLLASGLPDEEWYRGVLRRYFPPLLVERYGDRLEGHALRREIVTTSVVNDMINRGGITFTYRAGEETGAGPVEVARAFTVVREVFGLAEYWARVEALDNSLSTDAQCALYLEARRLVDRATRWIVQNRRSPLDVAAEIEHFRADVERLAPQMPAVLRGVERERLDRRAAELEAMGAPADLAMDASAMLDAFSLLDIVEIAQRVDEGAEQVGRLYFAISERFEVDRMLTRITRLPRDDRWAALARMALRYDLYGAQAGLVDSVIAATPGESDPDERIAAWELRNSEGLTRAKSTLREIAESDSFDLATMSVALRVIRTLVPSGR